MIISTDFDGTLCEHKFPEIGKPYTEIINYLIQYKKEGHKIILWTCREGQKLQEAIQWCKEQGLEFDAINENVPERKNQDYAIRKIYADIYLDDRNINPLDILKKREVK